jgi:NAD(P)-dependent dehydrogenase (short-subunit alcohol dehydrogenase family)
MSSWSVEQQVIAVTGAASGIGRHLAIALARRGATLALADIRGEALLEVSDQVAAAGSEADTETVDVTDAEQVRQWANGVASRFGRVDGVVANAGIVLGTRPVDAVPADQFRLIMDVNFWGAVNTSLAFLPHLRQRPRSALVIMASIAAEMAILRQTPYTTSKFAVRGFAEGIRLELADTDVRVTLVLPGAITGTPINLNAPGLMPGQAQVAHEAMQQMPLSTPVERAAERIVRGIERGRPRVLIGADAFAMDVLARVAPGGYTKIVRRPMSKLAATFISPNPRGMEEPQARHR